MWSRWLTLTRRAAPLQFKRLRAPRGYADYREMLRHEKPDLIGIGPRSLEEREQMVRAAAEAGAHMFTEKPFAGSPLEAPQKTK